MTLFPVRFLRMYRYFRGTITGNYHGGPRGSVYADAPCHRRLAVRLAWAYARKGMT